MSPSEQEEGGERGGGKFLQNRGEWPKRKVEEKISGFVFLCIYWQSKKLQQLLMQTARVLGTTRSEGGVQAMGAKVVGALRGLLQKGPEAASMRAKHEHRRQRKRRRTADKQEQQKQQDAERAQTAQRQTFSGSGDTMMRRAKKKKKKQKDKRLSAHAVANKRKIEHKQEQRREAAAQQQADGVTFTVTL